MKTKVIIFFAIVLTSIGVFAQPSPRPFNQNIDKEFIKEFLKTNPSYRLMEETKDGLFFTSPLPNKYYPSGGYTPDKPSNFHSYDINKKNKTIDEMMIEPDCEDKTFVMSMPVNCCQFRSTTKESFSIVNHCSKMGWLWMILGTWVSGAGGL